MSARATSPDATHGAQPAGPALALLPLAGLAFWLVVGLTWGPHNESFDWIVRLDTWSFAHSLVAQFPSVLSWRPIGVALAWLAFRTGGHDVALAQLVNAAFALAAWAIAARGVPERRAFALVALIAGGACFSGYIWVFHLHGIFYGPLLVYLAWLVRASLATPSPRTLFAALALMVVAALAHPYALPLAVAFAAGAVLETPALRRPAGLAAAAAIAAGAVATYLLTVPAHRPGVAHGAFHGWLVSYGTLEVNHAVSLLVLMLAARIAWTLAPGRAAPLASAAALAAGALMVRSGWPALLLWLALAAISLARRGRWTLAALLIAAAALPAANPTGSPTYALFAVLVAAVATALDDRAFETRLAWLGEPVAAAGLAAALALALLLRSGVPVPLASRVARPLLAERERSFQFVSLVDRLLASPWRTHPMRLLRDPGNPADVNALDRRFRPPTGDHHFQTWLAYRRPGMVPAGDTLVIAFGGERPAGAAPVLAVHGRFAGDALVFRRPASATTPPGPLQTTSSDARP